MKIKDTITETVYFTVNRNSIIIRQRNIVTGKDMIIKFLRKKGNFNKMLDYLKKRMII